MFHIRSVCIWIFLLFLALFHSYLHVLIDGLGLMLLVRILLLSELISMAYPTAVWSSSLSVNRWEFFFNASQAYRCHQQTKSCEAVVLWRGHWRQWGVNFLLPPLLHHLQSSCSLVDGEVSSLLDYLFQWIIVQEIMDILVALPLSFERNLWHFHSDWSK